METRKTFSDLGQLAQPAEALSPYGFADKWRVVPYKTAELSGTMVVSLGHGNPPDITIPLNSTGWHRIFVGVYTTGDAPGELQVKLSGDAGFSTVSACLDITFAEYAVQEFFWRCADITDQNLILGKHLSGAAGAEACIAWVRVEPMSEQEQADYGALRKDAGSKRLYVSNDMHSSLCFHDMRRPDAWLDVVQEVAESDTEWLSVERPGTFGDEVVPQDAFAFPRSYDELCTKQRSTYTIEMLQALVEYGHRQGLKMCMSQRTAWWGMGFPFDQSPYEDPFAIRHPEFRCVDRDGTALPQLSFCYPEVQEHVIGKLLWGLPAGFDALEMIMVRGFPYCLFETPFLERFSKVYGQDARYLPLDDPRITEQRCAVMTEFVRRLRERIDAFAPTRTIRLHASVPFSLWDCKHMGLDVETWAKEGLITAVITHDRRVRERLPETLWQQDTQQLDLQAYHRYAAEGDPLVQYDYDFGFAPPLTDSCGVLRGPASQQERIAEFMELEHKYGVTVYVNLMPRAMPVGDYCARAEEIYQCGCDHIALWDVNTRTCRKSEWAFTRWLGHKEELHKIASSAEKSFRKVRVLEIAGTDVSRYMPIWAG